MKSRLELSDSSLLQGKDEDRRQEIKKFLRVCDFFLHQLLKLIQKNAAADLKIVKVKRSHKITLEKGIRYLFSYSEFC
jgi:hypothetical protein